MTNVEKVSEIFAKHYQKWESSPERYSSGYHYEESYARMMQCVEKEVFDFSLGEKPIDKNKKKSSHQIWQSRTLQKTHFMYKPWGLKNKWLCSRNNVLCRTKFSF